ncbi:MAG: rhomboid family intramembrane serine protease [Bacteroidetes bacterium]|nr:rhomboid family intramembrane serine protease [Bacteroidota bacterium]
MLNMSMTLVIIIITALISIGAFSNEKLKSDLLFWPPAIRQKHQYYRFITSGLIHADWTHLIFNMLTLFSFGQAMEFFFISHLNSMGYLLFYLGGLIFSEVPSFIKHYNNHQYRSLGASGAVSAILFSFILMAPWQTLYVFFFPLPAIVFAIMYFIYSAYMAKKGGDGINHSAHIWGAVYGIIFTLILDPEVGYSFIRQVSAPFFNP